MGEILLLASMTEQVLIGKAMKEMSFVVNVLEENPGELIHRVSITHRDHPLVILSSEPTRVKFIKDGSSIVAAIRCEDAMLKFFSSVTAATSLAAQKPDEESVVNPLLIGFLTCYASLGQSITQEQLEMGEIFCQVELELQAVEFRQRRPCLLLELVAVTEAVQASTRPHPGW